KPLPKKILIHSPCTLKNVLKQESFPMQLVEKIPEIELIRVTHAHCCGAAGEYMLNHVEMANKLVEPLIKEIVNSRADILVTANIGCALHLRHYLKKLNCNIEIMHPVTLLARQLI